jgi:NAD-dependent dihydropyrimidine dehydrogenase PreA subunit
MNGLFAKLSILELRAEAGTCSGSCSSYACFKGGPADGEGLATAGCPLGTHPAHLTDNRNCVLCLTCAQACPHRSVQLRLRPPAADLQRTMAVPQGEPGLMLVLAGGVSLHHVTPLLEGLTPLPRFSLACLALAAPALVLLPLRPLLGAQRWRDGLYGLLPLLWGVLLARHLPLGLGEAGQLLTVSFGPDWPGWSADPHVIGFCQTLAVITGALGSVVLLRRMLRQEGGLHWLAALATVLLAAAGRWAAA